MSARRVALSDGTVEGPYQTQAIPRLFVIDRKGFIRFESTGARSAEDLARQVGWMIEAVRR
jgi:hypothetical protein